MINFWYTLLEGFRVKLIYIKMPPTFPQQLTSRELVWLIASSYLKCTAYVKESTLLCRNVYTVPVIEGGTLKTRWYLEKSFFSVFCVYLKRVKGMSVRSSVFLESVPNLHKSPYISHIFANGYISVLHSSLLLFSSPPYDSPQHSLSSLHAIKYIPSFIFNGSQRHSFTNLAIFRTISTDALRLCQAHYILRNSVCHEGRSVAVFIMYLGCAYSAKISCNNRHFDGSILLLWFSRTCLQSSNELYI